MNARFAAMRLTAGSILSMSVAVGAFGPLSVAVHAQEKATTASAQPQAAAPAPMHLELKALDASTTVFRDVNVVTMTDAGTLTRCTLVIKDGKIAQIEKDLKSIPQGAKVIDCGG